MSTHDDFNWNDVVEDKLALFVAEACSRHAADILKAGILEQAKQGGATEAEMASLLDSWADAKRRRAPVSQEPGDAAI
jgi:hypothetical protein